MNKVVTKNNFREKVLQNNGLSMVNFYADWNGASQMMIPVYDQLANTYSSMINFYSVDIDNEPALKEEYGIMELPTVLFFRNGTVVDHVAGIISKNAFIAKLENTLETKK
jgi:thioredoxin 1